MRNPETCGKQVPRAADGDHGFATFAEFAGGALPVACSSEDESMRGILGGFARDPAVTRLRGRGANSPSRNAFRPAQLPEPGQEGEVHSLGPTSSLSLLQQLGACEEESAW